MPEIWFVYLHIIKYDPNPRVSTDDKYSLIFGDTLPKGNLFWCLNSYFHSYATLVFLVLSISYIVLTIINRDLYILYPNIILALNLLMSVYLVNSLFLMTLRLLNGGIYIDNYHNGKVDLPRTCPFSRSISNDQPLATHNPKRIFGNVVGLFVLLEAVYIGFILRSHPKLMTRNQFVISRVIGVSSISMVILFLFVYILSWFGILKQKTLSLKSLPMRLPRHLHQH